MTAPEVIQAAVKSGIEPLLLGLGFRKNSKNFYKSENGCIQLVFPQSSRWNSADDAQVALNVGTYFPALAEMMGVEQRMPDPPRFEYCSVSQRARLSADAAADEHWWRATPATDPSELGKAMGEAIVNHGLPWLEKMSRFENALPAAEKRKSYWEAAALSLLLHEPRRAATYVKLWVELWQAHIAQYQDIPALIAKYPRGTPAMLEKTAEAERQRAEDFIKRIQVWAKEKGLEPDN